MQQVKFLTIDLTKIKGKGDFACPKCGINISPDDETEAVFTILEPIVKGEQLHKVILQCNKCKSQIHLIGFQLLKGIK